MALLHAVVNHIVLPPNIPGKQEPDADLDAVSYDILARMIKACKEVATSFANRPYTETSAPSCKESTPSLEAFQTLRVSLEACRVLNFDYLLDKTTLLKYFRTLEEDCALTLILHVVKQNAAILMRRDDGLVHDLHFSFTSYLLFLRTFSSFSIKTTSLTTESRDHDQAIIFEAMEVSPSSEDVLAASNGTLQWDFPGRCVRLPLAEFNNPGFQESLASFLEKSSTESLYSMQATAQKARVFVTEARDTTDPALVTQMLMPLLEAIGHYCQPSLLRKRVRDDVNMKDGDQPWRRLPFWLILRVAAHRHLRHKLGDQRGWICYKFLICCLLAELLKEAAGKLSPDLVITLRAKLCRRMAKLEMDRKESKSENTEVYDLLFSRIGHTVSTVVRDATAQVEAAWKSYKQAINRHIPKLPRRAPEHALRLSLPNSGAYLDNLLSSKPRDTAEHTTLALPQLDESIRRIQEYTMNIYHLASLDKEAKLDELETRSGGGASNGQDVRQFANRIYNVLADVGTTYDDDPEQRSAMVLTLFTLWVCLDRCAIQACPLLGDHRPPFSPGLLNVLQLPTLSDMQRLQDIQTYLNNRCNSRYGSILSKIDEKCLAVRFVAHSAQMQSLDASIQKASDKARRAKEAEWIQKCDEYDRHTAGMFEGVCRCTTNSLGQKEVKGCDKCWHQRVRKRMKIQIQENFLPESNPARAAVIFELAVPDYISAYRDATWQILKVLAHPKPPSGSPKPEVELSNHKSLKPYMEAKVRAISLASATKSFGKTHYKFNSGRVPLTRVLLPFAADFKLYDYDSRTWVEDLCQPLTLQHLCGVHIPRGLRDTILQVAPHPRPTFDAPSSYEIQANQSACPSDMSVHEFSAYQKLLGGEVRRWPNILVEMGSSNLNFSSEDTMRMLCQLAVQAGPQLTGEPLRAAHVIFKEQAFIERLVETIERRLKSIQTNWREHNCMELLITLSLRLFTLSSAEGKARAEMLLSIARRATLSWVTRLRKEIRAATDTDAAERNAMYGFFAALLCRRTFAAHVEMEKHIGPGDLTSWIQASVALQENMLTDIGTLPPQSRRRLIRDLKMAFYIEPHLRSAIKSHSSNIGPGIFGGWSDNSGEMAATSYSRWRGFPPPNDRWIVSVISESYHGFTYNQTVHFNFVEGHLLLNGKLRGKLPLEISDNVDVKRIFGNRHLLTYPSSLPGMSHRLASPMEGQEVHFGIRNGKVIIRARSVYGLLEFVPKELFAGPLGFDLPAELVENCMHWLNLRTGHLEVRRLPRSVDICRLAEIWVKRPRDWEVDVPRRKAFRGVDANNQGTYLVSPQSDLFSQVAKIFQNFERPERLTVFQPLSLKGLLGVELRHLDLSLYVNWKGLLECRQLNAEIDPDQDAGTWYGLNKIVLRDTSTHQRSIIVPLGDIKYERRGMHIEVRVYDAKEYGKYTIDNILGRLSCAPEPRLLYTRALFHALTSFCLPDPLIGRTGTEEAFSILQSGAAQPWIPLGGLNFPILEKLMRLSPQRDFYPAHLRRLQKVTWDTEKLTVTVQHDRYESLVRDIVEKSNRLNKFASSTAKAFETKPPSHLRARGESQRKLYERPTVDQPGKVTMDGVYIPRDRRATSLAVNVYQTARLVSKRYHSIHQNINLITYLESTQVIGGFHVAESPSPDKEPLISQIEDPVHEKWGTLVDLCRHANATAPLLFRLGLLAFNPEANMDAIHSLTSFALSDSLRTLEPPRHGVFIDFKSRGPPSLELLKELTIPAHRMFKPRTSRGHRIRDAAGRDEQAHMELCEMESWDFASHILSQWPNPVDELSTASLRLETIDVRHALDEIGSEWERRREVGELAIYAKQVQRLLKSLKGPRDTCVPQDWMDTQLSFRGKRHRDFPVITRDLVVKNESRLEIPGADLLVEPETSLNNGRLAPRATTTPSEIGELERLLGMFVNSTNELRQQYGNDLLRSLAAFKSSKKAEANTPPPAHYVVESAIERAQITVTTYSERISAVIASGDVRSRWLKLGNIWPCTTPIETLALIRTSSPRELDTSMKKELVSYGMAITHLQRLERILQALQREDTRAIAEELRNTGHTNWSPLEYSDWLLLEIDSDFLIRAEQVNVAREIIAPQSKENILLQMIMGKGKTFSIVPMVVAVLANGGNLARLLVPKALLMQTAQTIQAKLGGLVGREIRHIPFSRKTQTTPDMLSLYEDLHRQTRDLRGVILSSHEHILSYKVSGWQHLSDGKLEMASNMTTFQKWLDDHCRDVLDECDVTLSVKTQLNYPSGVELPVDGHPSRWLVAEDLLTLVAHHVPTLKRRFPNSIDLSGRQGSFPIVHFLKNDAEDALRDCILDDICAGRMTTLRPSDSKFRGLQSEIRHILSERKCHEESLRRASYAFVDPQAASKVLLVIRGLLIDKILLLCLNKRWNVQYGLHPSRHPVAVPFEAKGTPSEQSEFGHPDVAILFTCLSFYYGGLTPRQFRRSLMQVIQSDDPAAQYESWTSGAGNLPEALRHWNVINIDDETQIEELWKHLRYDGLVANHYLNHFVFPAHARQFQVKLQASAWDIPLFSHQTMQLGAKTTGFSGTNDNRYMLPKTIRQDDHPSLQQTSAELLSYILQPRNRHYQVMTDAVDGSRLTEEGLLRKLFSQEIRILIDAGAYVLEMGNKDLVDKWLHIDYKAKAAIFFGSDNRAIVHYKGETKPDVPLLATPFADNMSECVVYLDEAHTRGVDLKLPADARAALTLALKQTKDFTMQAAMRLRHLRTTQSVTFYAPPDVNQSILDFCRPAHSKIDSSHVVAWLLEQTCRTNEDLQSLHVAQGLDFIRRSDAEWRYPGFITDNNQRAKILAVLRQPERQTLEQLYGGASMGSLAGFTANTMTKITSNPVLQKLANQLVRSVDRCTGPQVGAMEEVEQEREVQVQLEQVRQVQKPIKYEALSFTGLHSTILAFVRTGRLDVALSGPNDVGFEQAFAYMAKTTVGKQFGVRETGSALFVSKQFGRTVQQREGDIVTDNFLRPVEWILWSPSAQIALIVIPEEAELLIPLLRRAADKSPVHLIAYAAPVTKGMLSFNSLQYYVVPPLPPKHNFPEWLRFEVGLLAGRLYIDLAEWDPLAHYLHADAHGEGQAAPEGANGTVSPATFADNPRSFIFEWLTLRRESQDVLHTPMGYICTGRPLGEHHPFRQTLS
ncbi:hypothetical protein SLS62_008284 [Diatrype stigma]|uniref:ubiquitinyl hydrolase 1 n=1 Tax=Diatrype stigma TaxID=117547 RepID=A0AAN9YP74_9PEZI